MYNSNIKVEWSQLQSPFGFVKSRKVKLAEFVSMVLFVTSVLVSLM